MIDEKLTILFRVIGIPTNISDDIGQDECNSKKVLSENFLENQTNLDAGSLELKEKDVQENNIMTEKRNTNINLDDKYIEDKQELKPDKVVLKSIQDDNAESKSKELLNRTVDVEDELIKSLYSKSEVVKQEECTLKSKEGDNKEHKVKEEFNLTEVQIEDQFDNLPHSEYEEIDTETVEDKIGHEFKEAEMINKTEVEPESKVSNNELEAFIILLNKYNININGRSRQSKGLFDFGYISGQAVITKDDLVVYVEKEEPEQKKKRGLLSWISGNKNKEKSKTKK